MKMKKKMNLIMLIVMIINMKMILIQLKIVGQWKLMKMMIMIIIEVIQFLYQIFNKNKIDNLKNRYDLNINHKNIIIILHLMLISYLVFHLQ